MMKTIDELNTDGKQEYTLHTVYAKVNVFSCIVFVKWLKASFMLFTSLFFVRSQCKYIVHASYISFIQRHGAFGIQHWIFNGYLNVIYTCRSLAHIHIHTRTRRFIVSSTQYAVVVNIKFILNSLTLTHLFAKNSLQFSEACSSIFHFVIENQQPWNRYLM